MSARSLRPLKAAREYYLHALNPSTRGLLGVLIKQRNRRGTPRLAYELAAVDKIYERWWRASSTSYLGYTRVTIWAIDPAYASVWNPQTWARARVQNLPNNGISDGLVFQMIVMRDLLIAKGFDPNVIWKIAEIYDTAYDREDAGVHYEWEELLLDLDISDDQLHVIFDAAIEGRRI